MSLKGVCKSQLQIYHEKTGKKAQGGYGSLSQNDATGSPPPEVAAVLRDLLYDAFQAYDKDRNNELEKSEIKVFLKDFHETISDEEISKLLKTIDANDDEVISFEEFIVMAYHLIMNSDRQEAAEEDAAGQVRDALFDSSDDEEQEEIPEEFTDLSPEEQQKAIKWRAFKMLSIGTIMVIYFSDPMVDVMQEIAVRAGISPFYVSFVLAPLASNASEVVASMFYAAKKTRKTMTVSLSALEGAACMNNTFCLSIFMALIFFRGLAWQYTAETISIVIVELIMALMVRSSIMTTGEAFCVLSIFPLSLVLVATLEYFGFD